ncbi:(3R)-hydroxyacyl-ACP dehydratase subunit HadB [Sphingomonas oligophenolica]
MQDLTFDQVAIGDGLPEFITAPISRTTLALYAGASADHNPLHIDSDFAKSAGMTDVFAHGMLSMAYLAQLLTRWVRQEQIISWRVRFLSITPLHAQVVCSGEIIEKIAGEKQVKLAIKAKIKDGADTLAGEALVRLP